MPASFKIKDGLKNLGVRAPFGVNEDGVHIFSCLRLLCGTVNLEDKSSGEMLRLRDCFLTQDKRKLSSRTMQVLVDAVFDGELTVADVEQYLQKVRRHNVNFWEDVTGEICLALVCRARSQWLESFLHIYRLLELTSVALPLFYASAEHDYRKSLSFLKGLPQSPNDGDLAIMRRFVTIVAKEGGYETYAVKIPYSKGDLSWDRRFEEQIDSCIVQYGKLNATVNVAEKTLEVPFMEFPSFLVTYRNRVFHNTLSTQNLNLDKLGGAGNVCEPIIDPALNWFTLLVCAILVQGVSRYQ